MAAKDLSEIAKLTSHLNGQAREIGHTAKNAVDRLMFMRRLGELQSQAHRVTKLTQSIEHERQASPLSPGDLNLLQTSPILSSEFQEILDRTALVKAPEISHQAQEIISNRLVTWLAGLLSKTEPDFDPEDARFQKIGKYAHQSRPLEEKISQMIINTRPNIFRKNVIAKWTSNSDRLMRKGSFSESQQFSDDLAIFHTAINEELEIYDSIVKDLGGRKLYVGILLQALQDDCDRKFNLLVKAVNRISVAVRMLFIAGHYEHVFSNIMEANSFMSTSLQSVISELIYRLENFAKDEIDIMTETASQFDIISSGEESPTIRLYCEVLKDIVGTYLESAPFPEIDGIAHKIILKLLLPFKEFISTFENCFGIDAECLIYKINDILGKDLSASLSDSLDLHECEEKLAEKEVDELLRASGVQNFTGEQISGFDDTLWSMFNTVSEASGWTFEKWTPKIKNFEGRKILIARAKAFAIMLYTNFYSQADKSETVGQIPLPPEPDTFASYLLD